SNCVHRGLEVLASQTLDRRNCNDVETIWRYALASASDRSAARILVWSKLEAMLTLASVMRSEMKKRKLEFSSHPGNLALMRNFVRHFLDNITISERDRTLMVLGVDEACTNIIRHAYELRDDKLIALSLEIRDDCVRMRLRDYGLQPTVEALHR